jgi:hypothetical protein
MDGCKASGQQRLPVVSQVVNQNNDAPIEQVRSEAVFQKPSSHWMARASRLTCGKSAGFNGGICSAHQTSAFTTVPDQACKSGGTPTSVPLTKTIRNVSPARPKLQRRCVPPHVHVVAVFQIGVLPSGPHPVTCRPVWKGLSRMPTTTTSLV